MHIYGMGIMMVMHAVRLLHSVLLHVIQEVSIQEKDMYVFLSVIMAMVHGLYPSQRGMVIISEHHTVFRLMVIMDPAEIIFRDISIIQ